MGLDDIKKLFEKSTKTGEIVFGPDLAAPVLYRLRGIAGSALSFIASAVFRQNEVHHLFIFNDREEAAFFYNDLQNLITPTRVFFFPHSGRKPYEPEDGEQTLKKKDSENVLMRAEVLNAINTRKRHFAIVTYPEALQEKVVTRQHLEKNTLNIGTGEKLSLEFINELLFEFEFDRVDFVYKPGQFAIRGGIVDIWSFSNDRPFRVEFYGDAVDSIRTFDPVSQVSVKDHAKITIIPDVQEKLLRESRQAFFEFLPKTTVAWTKNPELTEERLDEGFQKIEEAYGAVSKNTKHIPPGELYVSKEAFLASLEEFSQVEFDRPGTRKPDVEIRFQQSPQASFNKNFDLLINDLTNHQHNGFSNYIFASNPKQIERLHQIFEDIRKNREIEEHPFDFEGINTAIHEGFVDHDLKIAAYTDHQIFERYHRYRLKEGFADAERQITLKELTDLQPGDFVVHIDHGIGQYSGIQKIEVNGKTQEAIRLLYSGDDVLYVSIHSLHRISKYVGKEGTEPKINKLGSNAWQNLKNKTKKKVKEIAYDLIKLYAERKSKKGFAFSPDTYLQTELESSFIYEDTPDQEKATEAVKKDMEKPYPMDRLVCGDVGFGKTEIAIRAAFKAAVDGKQVAVLAPTTILTSQHYKTFRERLKDFPVTVDYINRFRSSKQQKETLKKLEEGKVDILIGTHRLVGKDVKFHDLGLLVIDEEQKFGVGVKDKLKTMKVNVDTLTLTATPIPRTLQFSLMAARDLSVINTPPPNRFPVQTELHTFNETVIKDAIYAELARNGQVFFVHNRVQNIGEVCEMIRKIVPGARVDFAHGQMEGDVLEDKMLRFVDGDFDVLVATTIIESGLDISNANTIIINQAQNFGLSDLHQMRGRVGRSNKKAFCYLLCPPLSTLTNEARKRLQAIEQFSDLGSGFNIAMRDLDIRGAGNLLGGEQSGFISDIGYETYQKILDEAIQELKENEFKDLFLEEKEREFVQDCQVETDYEIHIPDNYVNNITERMSLYRELAKIDDMGQLNRFREELVDRFGPVPGPTERLLETKRMQWAGKAMGLEKVVLKSKKLVGWFVPDKNSPFFESARFTKVLQYVQENGTKAQLRERNDRLSIVFTNVVSIEKAIGLLEDVMVLDRQEV